MRVALSALLWLELTVWYLGGLVTDFGQLSFVEDT